MSRWLARRAGAAMITFALTLAVAFALLEALPGGPGAVVDDPRIPRAERARLERALGLDRPAPERFVRFAGAALRGDWGISFAHQRPVSALVGEALPWTARLAAAALALEMTLALALGTLGALRAGGRSDRLLRAGLLALVSIPSFALALVLLRALAIDLPLLPAAAFDDGRALLRFPGATLVLPALALGLPAAAASSRFARAALIETLARPFVVAARARGLGGGRVLFGHALRAASAPLVELAALSTAGLLSGAVAIEVVFARPGLGRLAYDALGARDYPVLLATTAVAAAAVIAAHFAGDLAHAALDPRVATREER